MWRPRGELQEALAVGIGTALIAIAVMAVASPKSLDALLLRRPSVGELAAREDLGSLAVAQERYYARTGRYAYDLSSIPWQSGFGIFIRVRSADSTGFTVSAVAGRRPRMRCEMRVRRADSTVIDCVAAKSR